MDGSDGAKKSSGVPAVGLPTRPKAWQQLWLDKHREAMVGRLQGVVMSIADRLVQERHMDPVLDETYQFIHSVHTLPVEKVRSLLDWLRCRSAEAFEHFQSALVEKGCGDLAAKENDIRELEAAFAALPLFERCTMELGVPVSVEVARRLLQKEYTLAASAIYLLADVCRSKDGSRRNLDEVAINIGLVSTNTVEQLCAEWTGQDLGVDKVLCEALQENKVTLGDLIGSKVECALRAPVRVLAVGAAGSGKSFVFTLKATHDWCEGQLWQQIALLRTVRCRDKSVWRARTISELFRLEELGLTTKEETGVRDFIAKRPESVILVCDGLDEGCIDKDSFLWRVLTGSSLCGLCVIITSRPCSAASDLSQSGAIHRHVQMFGFTEKNVSEFAVKYLGKCEGREMIRQMSRQPWVKPLTHTPFFALLICEQFKEEGQIPSRRSDVFGSVTLRVVQRCAKRRGLKASFKRLDKAPKMLYEQVLEVAKVAFERLKRKDLSYFELDDEELSEEAVQLGFLEHTQASSLYEADQYGFRHLTVQEYLAALYASTEVLKTADDVARLVKEVGCGEKAGHLNTFWVFVSGLLPSTLRENLLCSISKPGDKRRLNSTGSTGTDRQPAYLVTSAREGGVSPHAKEVAGEDGDKLDKYRFLLLLHCFQEVKSDSCVESSECVLNVLRKHGMDCRGLHDLLYSDVTISVIVRIIELHKDILEKFDIGFCHLEENSLSLLLSGLRGCSRLREIDLCGNLLHQQHLAAISEVLADSRQTLEVVDLGAVVHLEHNGSVAVALTRLKCLKRLRLSNAGTHTSGRAVAQIVEHQPSLVECCLRGHINDTEFAVYMAPALQKCKHIEKLHLTKAGLTSNTACMAALALVLVSFNRLTELTIDRSPIKDEGFLHIASAVLRCTHLRCLRLKDCFIQGKGATLPLLVLILLGLPHLETFSVGGNPIGDAGFAQISIGIEECSQLTSLDLRAIKVTSTRTALIICRMLRRFDHLKELFLGGNVFTSETDFIKLRKVAEKHRSLKYVFLPGTSMNRHSTELKLG